jgi:4a-hydroxytetrahydrobiopterin dehydratase
MAVPALTEAEITERLTRLEGWERVGDAITKTYKLDSYTAGLALAVTVGTIAEAHNHHPDLTIGWRQVTVRFTTHDAGHKLSEKDFAAAAAIESIGYPRKA